VKEFLNVTRISGRGLLPAFAVSATRRTSTSSAAEQNPARADPSS